MGVPIKYPELSSPGTLNTLKPSNPKTQNLLSRSSLGFWDQPRSAGPLGSQSNDPKRPSTYGVVLNSGCLESGYVV